MHCNYVSTDINIECCVGSRVRDYSLPTSVRDFSLPTCTSVRDFSLPTSVRDFPLPT